MSGYESDRRWSDRFAYTIAGIAARLNVVVAPEDMDRRAATDLVVLSGRVAYRVRRRNWFRHPYWREFTVRTARASGVETEHEKLHRNRGVSLMVYGFAHVDERSLLAWMALDLEVWRDHEHAARPKDANETLSGEGFYAYSIDRFPPNLVIAQEGIPARPSFVLSMPSKRNPQGRLF